MKKDMLRIRLGVLLSFFILFIIFSSSINAGPIVNRSRKFPVLLLPGDGGSEMWATLNKPKVVHRICTKKQSKPFLLWLSPEDLIPFIADCFIDNIRLTWDPIHKRTLPSPGVNVTVPGFGSTASIEYLSNIHISHTSYFYNLVEQLSELMGYERNASIRGAPYDFRKTPKELGKYMNNMRQLIEVMYKENDNAPVIMLGHSLGCLMAHHFLTRQTQHWKDKYIKAYISVAGPYTGAIMSIVAELAGDDEHIPTLTPLMIRPALRSWPSTGYLMPIRPTWTNDDVLVTTKEKNYTVDDYGQLFKDMGFADGYDMYKTMVNTTNRVSPPRVRTYCIYSDGVSTPEKIDYTDVDDFPDDYPSIQYGDGDGTVNLRSLKVCSEWKKQQEEDVIDMRFHKLSHLDIVREPVFAHSIMNIIQIEHSYP